MAQYNVNNTHIHSLLSWIRDGEIAIPEIQRPFVWDSTKVRDLIDSLYAGFPVGYIIAWKNPDIRLKDGSTSYGKKILIDGQQRITALEAALIGVPVLRSNYQKKPIKIAFNPLTECFEVSNPAIEKDTAWIPDIAPIFQPDFDSFVFVNDYSKSNHVDPSTVNKVIVKLQSVQNNDIGVIELDSQLDISKVTEIFIRINSKGAVLSQADFAMSKISADERYGGNNIRKTIDYFCHLMQRPEDLSAIYTADSKFTQTANFEKLKWVTTENDDIYAPDYTDVLRVAFTEKFSRGKIADLVSLLSGRNFETRDYQEDIAEKSFSLLASGVSEFVDKTNFQRYLMIIKSTGIVSPHMIRSQNVINFGYALYLLLRSRGKKPEAIEKIVRRWIVLSILTGRYSGSAESAFDYDIKRFQSNDAMSYLTNIENGELSDAFWKTSLIDKLETSVASSPIFNVFLMAQVKANDCGFLSEQIEVRSLIEQRGDIHHIFPKKYLQSNGINSRGNYNQIANYVYTQTETNIKIKDRAPAIYMTQVKKQCENGILAYGGIHDIPHLLKNLESNCIPSEIFEMDYTRFDEFLTKRRRLMAQKIHSFYESLK